MNLIPNSKVESALSVLVPEAEGLVAPFREQFDPSAAVGVPAHVSVVYPFKPPSEIDANIVDSLRDLFANVPSFRVSFERTGRFPAVLYLAPEPAAPFVSLTETVTMQFPEAQPYGGKFADIVPHLTIAHANDAQPLDTIANQFQQAAGPRLPIKSAACEVVLMDNRGGRWQVRYRFPLCQL